MKLGEIFHSEDMKAEEKVAKIAGIVAKARENYGNKDKIITEPEVNTADGVFKLSMLSAKDKVAAAASSYKTARIMAGEAAKEEGTLPDRVVEAFIACDPVLCNIGAKTESDYL